MLGLQAWTLTRTINIDLCIKGTAARILGEAVLFANKIIRNGGKNDKTYYQKAYFQYAFQS